MVTNLTGRLLAFCVEAGVHEGLTWGLRVQTRGFCRISSESWEAFLTQVRRHVGRFFFSRIHLALRLGQGACEGLKCIPMLAPRSGVSLKTSGQRKSLGWLVRKQSWTDCTTWASCLPILSSWTRCPATAEDTAGSLPSWRLAQGHAILFCCKGKS